MLQQSLSVPPGSPQLSNCAGVETPADPAAPGSFSFPPLSGMKTLVRLNRQTASSETHLLQIPYPTDVVRFWALVKEGEKLRRMN